MYSGSKMLTVVIPHVFKLGMFFDFNCFVVQ